MTTDTTPALPVVAHMWQHDETGMTGFVEDAPLNELAHWEHMNRPRKIICELTRLDNAISALTAALARAEAAERERDAALAQCKLLEHQVITCGVAATHPDADLTTTGAYADKWNSRQAEEVRALRRERDALRAALVELELPWAARAAVAGVPKPIQNPSVHQAEMPIPGVRTDRDASAKALEFAEYMAKKAEHLLDAINAEDAERDRDDEITDATEHIDTSRDGYFIHIARAIEFALAKKRGEHAAKAGSGENE